MVVVEMIIMNDDMNEWLSLIGEWSEGGGGALVISAATAFTWICW